MRRCKKGALPPQHACAGRISRGGAVWCGWGGGTRAGAAVVVLTSERSLSAALH